MKFFFAVNI